MEHIRSEFIQATASRLEAIENRVNDLGPQAAAKDDVLKNLTGFRYKKGSNKASFSGVISSQTYNFAKEMLEDLENEKEIHISVNSPGGSAVTGVALAHLLNDADQRVVMTATGQAYSAAGVMMQGADERHVAPGSYIGVHRSWVRTSGNESDFSRMAAELRKNDENILEIFSSVVPDHKMGKFKELMEKDTALSGKEAVDMGIADKVLTRRSPKASVKVKGADEEVKNQSNQEEADKNYAALAMKLDDLISMLKPVEEVEQKVEEKEGTDFENRVIDSINQIKDYIVATKPVENVEEVVNEQSTSEVKKFEKAVDKQMEKTDNSASEEKESKENQKGPTRHFQLSVPLA